MDGKKCALTTMRPFKSAGLVLGRKPLWGACACWGAHTAIVALCQDRTGASRRVAGFFLVFGGKEKNPEW